MRQTTLSVAFDVKPESFETLGALLDGLHARRPGDDNDGPYADFLSGVPVLHFLSLSLFPGHDLDPLLVLEANFDGPRGPFFAQLEAAIGDDLRQALRCCKQPRDEKKVLYAAVTAPLSKAPLAPYLEACAIGPSAFHHGNRGLERARIEKERDLFVGVHGEIEAQEAQYRAMSPPQIHLGLRKALIERFPWLAERAAPRISAAERLGDKARLLLFAFAVVFALSIPSLVLGLALPLDIHAVLMVVATVALGWRLSQLVDSPGGAAAGSFRSTSLGPILAILIVFLFVYWLLATVVATPFAHYLTRLAWKPAFDDSALWIRNSLMSVIPTALGLLVWIRLLERRDSSQDKPPVDPLFLREMAKREDWIPQNHMGSIVLIKPGVLRTIVIRAGHLGLHLLLRVIATDGFLGSMRTIHFAHWAFINNTSRLIFFSNFDQTWESYLDDFIEKAHEGLTLAWGSGVGFPPARVLLLDGASKGRQFKEWARHSMAVSHFWYSAYKDLTTEQVERNLRVAEGLRKPYLNAKEAAAWLNDL